MRQQSTGRGAVRQKSARQKSSRKAGGLNMRLPQINIKPFLRWATRLLVVGVLSVGAYFLWPQLNKPVAEVELLGSLERVDRAELRVQVESAITSGLLTLKLDELDENVEKIDWVYAAEIQKRWPQRLSIHIEEEQPVARWGDLGYLAASGKMVRSQAYEDLIDLPGFHVLVASPRETLDLFYGLNSAMLTNGMGIQELHQSQFGSWSMIMENGSEIVLGKDDLMIRMRRVMKAWQLLTPEMMNELETVDARYPNGIAVKYRKQIVQVNMPHREKMRQSNNELQNEGWKT